MLGLRDYVNKNGFPGIILACPRHRHAISAAIAVDALGAARVRAVMLPSPYTSAHSLEDAAGCARLLGIRYDTVPISGAVDAFQKTLSPLFAETQPDITEETCSPARALDPDGTVQQIRHMVLTTGNKSEMSVATPRCTAICAAAIRC